MRKKNSLFQGLLGHVARARGREKAPLDKGPGKASGPPIRQPDIDAVIRVLKEQCGVPTAFIRTLLKDDGRTLRLEIHDGTKSVYFAEFGKNEAGMFIANFQSMHARMKE